LRRNSNWESRPIFRENESQVSQYTGTSWWKGKNCTPSRYW
jgi:hypothetical protein